MDKVHLKLLFQKHKSFLRRTYMSTSASQAINAASEEELKLLLLILHAIAIGEIPISSQGKEIIQKAHRLKKLQSFASRHVMLNYQNSERPIQIKILRQFLKLFPILLSDLFKRRH